MKISFTLVPTGRQGAENTGSPSHQCHCRQVLTVEQRQVRLMTWATINAVEVIDGGDR